MNSYSLSICIPTYNFGEFIAETLDSIVSQINEEVEVLVVDGASTDATSDIVQSYVDSYPQVKYYCLEERGGIDRDISTSIDLATGKYCWMFSADDIMEPGAIRKVLLEIHSGCDVYICRHINCTIDMLPIADHRVLDLSEDTNVLILSSKDRQGYFELAETTEAFFSFMGGLIIKRARWKSIPLNEDFVGSCWAHAARLLELMLKGLTLMYIHEPCLKKRGENDSFRESGVVKRYRLAIRGYNRLADTFFGESSIEAFHVRRVLRNEFTLKQFLYAKLLCYENPDIENIVILNNVVDLATVDFSFRNISARIIYRLMPFWACRLARYGYLIWLKRNGRFLDSDRLGK